MPRLPVFPFKYSVASEGPVGEPAADGVDHIGDLQKFVFIGKGGVLDGDDLAEVHIRHDLGVESGQHLGGVVGQGEKREVRLLPGLLLPFLDDFLEGFVLLGDKAFVPPDDQFVLGECRSGRKNHGNHKGHDPNFQILTHTFPPWLVMSCKIKQTLSRGQVCGSRNLI